MYQGNISFQVSGAHLCNCSNENTIQITENVTQFIVKLLMYANNLILVDIHEIIISIYRGLNIQLYHFAD